MGLLDERYIQEQVIPDELIRSCHVDNALLRLRSGGAEDQLHRTLRGHVNMIVVTGGEGICSRLLSARHLYLSFLTHALTDLTLALSRSSDPDMVEIKSDVRCAAFHEGNEALSSVWIDLCHMTTPRIGHGMVEAGETHSTAQTLQDDLHIV